MPEYGVVGQPLPRVDARAKVTGEARFTVDLSLPGMLHGKLLRSPLPHARVLHVDTSRAASLSGVRAVITGKDTLGRKYGAIPGSADMYPLALEKVRYIGDEVAAVAAVNEDVAQEALDLIRVDYEELPAVFDPQEAMRPGAPLVHDMAPLNTSASFTWEFGDVRRGFREADHVREDRFETQCVAHGALEPHGAVAFFDSGGKLTVWASTQIPFFLRTNLARTLGMSESDIRVIKPPVGGGFGGKVDMLSCHFCASLLSMKTHRPVRVVYDREEVFVATRLRHAMVVELRTGVKKDGTLVARQCRLIADGGAYNSTGPLAIYIAGSMLGLPYRLPNVKYEGYHVYTNKPICGAMRGHGTPQVYFAAESQLDLLAQDLSIDPLELRLRNALAPGEVTASGFCISSCGFKDCLTEVSERASLGNGPRQAVLSGGLGLGCSGGVSGAANVIHPTSAIVRLDPTGALALFTGASDIGQGSDTVLAQIAAEELGLLLEDVRVVAADTDTTPLDPGSFSSRVTFWAGKAVKAAATEVRKQLLEVAADKLEARPDDLDCKAGWVFVKGSPDKRLLITEVLKALLLLGRSPLVGTGHYRPAQVDLHRTVGGNISPAYTFGA
ncbi:MAG: molybdopterin-dependent oxidoreductase, partial [Dehalococcoidia bacterium]|nr:molybdopterin-dependent oxidoreductase [Dehalococcoidia bacterium]